jgi:hypothetical protein
MFNFLFLLIDKVQLIYVLSYLRSQESKCKRSFFFLSLFLGRSAFLFFFIHCLTISTDGCSSKGARKRARKKDVAFFLVTMNVDFFNNCIFDSNILVESKFFSLFLYLWSTNKKGGVVYMSEIKHTFKCMLYDILQIKGVKKREWMKANSSLLV